MIPSLAAAVTGIDANQTMLDVIGNNIANVDTTGFQAGSTQFADLLNQQIAGATAPGPTTGGTNPVSVGSGTHVVANDTSFAQGTLQQTGQPTDVAIQGQGFFVGQQGIGTGALSYTRDGNFSINANGDLVTNTGAYVQGWQATNGVVNPNGPTQAVVIPQGQAAPPNQTQNLNLSGNIPANPGGTTLPSAITFSTTAYDSLGNPVPISVTFTPSSTANQWTMQASANVGGTATNLFATAPTVTFTSSGQLKTVTPSTTSTAGATLATSTTSPFPNGKQVNFDFPAVGSPSAVTQFAGNQSIVVSSQDGYTGGTLQKFTVGSDGTVTGTYSNGQTQTIGQLALANFSNLQGLAKIGNGAYQSTVASGPAQIGVPGTAGRGTLVGGALEGSNVDLGTELTNLIVAQNAYQANTKVVTTSNMVLQALENMP